jgi:transposase
MKRMTPVMASWILGLGLVLSGCTSDGIPHKRTLANLIATDSVEYHATALREHQENAAILEQKIQKLEQRIEAFKKKPYRDPKGFRQTGWKRLVDHWKQEIKDLRTQMAWHRNELTRLRASTNEHRPTTEQSIENS